MSKTLCTALLMDKIEVYKNPQNSSKWKNVNCSMQISSYPAVKKVKLIQVKEKCSYIGYQFKTERI